MLKTIKVSGKGQIAIPQIIRENMGIDKGDELILVQLNDKLLIEKSNKTEEKMKDNFNDLLKFSERALKEVWDNKEDEIWRKYLEK